MSYLTAKSGIIVPIMFVFALLAVGLPGYVILCFPADSLGLVLSLWAACIYSFECLAEALAIWINDPLLGILIYMLWYFMSFLFSGVFVLVDDLFIAFKPFHYIVPFTYC